jgi:ParE toxin of type II toxin-antitoxin system, parDE
VTIRFLRVAQAEFDEAMARYRSAMPGLDEAFRADVIAKLEQIAIHTRSSPELAPDIRRAPLRRFPFLLVYTFADGDIIVLAGAHMRRRPRRWRDRLAKA